MREVVFQGIDACWPFACTHPLLVAEVPVSLTSCWFAVMRTRPSEHGRCRHERCRGQYSSFNGRDGFGRKLRRPEY